MQPSFKRVQSGWPWQGRLASPEVWRNIPTTVSWEDAKGMLVTELCRTPSSFTIFYKSLHIWLQFVSKENNFDDQSEEQIYMPNSSNLTQSIPPDMQNGQTSERIQGNGPPTTKCETGCTNIKPLNSMTLMYKNLTMLWHRIYYTKVILEMSSIMCQTQGQLDLKKTDPTRKSDPNPPKIFGF